MKNAANHLNRFKLILSYDGTNYHGWQLQKGHTTVQEVLEEAITKIIHEKIRVTAAGRTDAGVHALGQVVHFSSNTYLPLSVLKKAINSRLPDDVQILTMQKVSKDFHARFSAKSKIYQYHIWLGETLPVFQRHFLLHHAGKFDVLSAKKAVQVLKGRHDFSSFAVNPNLDRKPLRDKVRLMKNAKLKKKGNLIIIELEAEGFLYKMVRSIAGTLLDVGEGKLSVNEFKRILKKKDRRLAGQTAPPHGLILVKVKY